MSGHSEFPPHLDEFVRHAFCFVFYKSVTHTTHTTSPPVQNTKQAKIQITLGWSSPRTYINKRKACTVQKHPEQLALVFPKELVQLAPRQLSPVHRVEAFPVEALCGASLSVVEQGVLQPFLGELHRLHRSGAGRVAADSGDFFVFLQTDFHDTRPALHKD